MESCAVNVRLPKEVYKEFKIYCAKEELTLKDGVAFAIKHLLSTNPAKSFDKLSCGQNTRTETP